MNNETLLNQIKSEIEANGPMSFQRFMELALYAPGLGYYSANNQKFGEDGDFTTAPELSPLFAQCIAKQANEVLTTLDKPCVLEFGAGSGAFAYEFLNHVEIDTYYILEVSADLRARQQTLLKEAHPDKNIIWLDRLPEQPIEGLIFANEILDAMPVNCFAIENNQIFERSVALEDGKLQWRNSDANNALKNAVENLKIDGDEYHSEINLMIKPWLQSVSDCLSKGLVLLIDYGFERKTYYHPDRHMGTLMCHFCHRALTDPFVNIGHQDITAHVDFTAVAEAADAAKLDIAGYTNQSSFLLSLGIEQMAQSGSVEQQVAASRAVQMLAFPHQMGELFKVMALTRGFDDELKGFELQDLMYKL